MKDILKDIISFFVKFTTKLIKAYDLTYGGEELAKLFSFDVKLRQDKNRHKFIAEEMEKIIKEDDNISFQRAYEKAVMRFKEAKLNKELDVLNSRKGD